MRAAAFYLGLALLVALPALQSSEPAFLGHPDSDMWKHAWGHWWLGNHLRHFSWPIFTTLQNYPWGGNLFVIDPFNAMLAAVLGIFVPPTASFNAIVVGQLALAGWGAWRLATRLTGDSWAALVAGVVYGFSPWVLSYSVSSGVSETLGLAWIPLSAHWMLGAAEGQRRDVPLAAAALFLAGFNSWYYLFFALLLWGLLAGGALLGSLPAWPAWRHVVIAGMLAAVALSPLAWKFSSSMATKSLGPIDREEFAKSPEYLQNFFTVSDFVLPGKDRLRVTSTVDRLAQTPYLGLLALALAILAWRRREARVWAWGAAIFCVLSLGPMVGLTRGWGSSAPINGLYWLWQHGFGLWLATSPSRIHVLTTLCVAMLAAFGLARFTAARPVLGMVAAGLVFAEVGLLSPAEFPVPISSAAIPAVYDGLALDEKSGVFDVPPVHYNSQLIPGQYYFYQTRHGGGIPYRAGGVFDARLTDNRYFTEMWRLGVGVWPAARDPVSAAVGLEALGKLGYRHVVLHADRMPPRAFASALATLRRWLGPPVASDGGTVRFVLTPLATRSAKSATMSAAP
ncbi:MAG: hypothetical protein FJX76_01820 [Armatimonadetes bacterium]|nr:hypothetical protein [Armatimonadota bacterium]